MRVFITNGQIVTRDSITAGSLVIENGKILEVGYKGEIPKGAKVIDAWGKYVLPGFVELHAHGGGGCDFMDGTVEAFNTVAQLHRSHGTTTILPTTVACSTESMLKMFETYREALSGKKIINYSGLHLEGPFISQEMRGAQNPAFVRCPSREEVDTLLGFGGDIIRKCTVAPEIEGVDYLTDELRKRNIALSIGHSNGTYADVEAAYNMGYCHITHMYSNTPSVRKINQVVYAGIIEAAYSIDGMCIEFIGDGHHLPKEVLKMALKIKGADKINLTSDAMRAAGTEVAESFLGECREENRVIIEDGVAKLPDRSYYAGSITTGDKMLRWAVNDCGVSICDAAKMLSLTPAKIIGLSADKGSLEPGKDADIVFADKELNVEASYIFDDFISRGVI